MSELVTRIVNLPPARRRALALALLVLAFIATVVSVWGSLSSLAEARHELMAKRELAGRLEQVASLRPMLERSSQSLEQAGMQGDYLEGDSEAVARGSLQAMLTGFAKANQAAVTSAGNVPDLVRDGVAYAGIRLEFSGTVEALHATLLAIETARPPLTIREASIWTTSGTGGAQAPKLVAQLKVFGAMRLSDTAGGESRP